MDGTPDQSLLVRSPSASHDPCLSQQAFAKENLLRLLRLGSAQTIAAAPDNTPTVALSDTLFNEHASAAVRYSPAPMPCGETCSTASAAPATSGESRTASASSSEEVIEGWRAHLDSDPPMDRVSHREVLNDVSGRKRKVFRKSPCPPRARYSSPGSDTEDPEGLS